MSKKHVLHLSNSPLSNAPANLVTCLNDCSENWSAGLILGKLKGNGRSHNTGKTWFDMTAAEITQEFEKADVVHFHNFAFSQDIFKLNPRLRRIAASKKRVIQYHSPRFSTENFEDTISDKSMKHAVIAQYHVRIYPECEFVVPNLVPIYKEEYKTVPWKYQDGIPIVMYTPSNINGKDWDDKGYRYVEPVLTHLDRRMQINKDICIGVSYEECMKRKRWAWIGIDEFMTGSYHLSALEFMSMGALTFCRTDVETKKAMEKVAGTEAVNKLPFVECDRYTFANKLESTLKWTEREFESAGQEARRWMETYWDPSKMIKHFEDMYACL